MYFGFLAFVRRLNKTNKRILHRLHTLTHSHEYKINTKSEKKEKKTNQFITKKK